MNEHFQSLLAELQIGSSIRADELVDALYVVRAHKSLAAIIPVTRHFLDLCDRYPALALWPKLERYEQRLAVLHDIAALETTDPNLSGKALASSDPGTPLRPLTGDSCIADILLIEAAGGDEQKERFQHLVAWYVWQAQRFHKATTPASLYKAYLTDGQGRLDDHGKGNRLYGAFRGIRELADPSNRDRLCQLLTHGLEMSAEHSVRLTLLGRLQRLRSKTAQRALIRHAIKRHGFTDEQQLRADSESFDRAAPGPLMLFLSTIWLPQLKGAMSSRSSAGGARGRQVYRPRVHRSKYLTEIVSRVDEDGVHAGTVVDLFFKPDKDRSQSLVADPEDDDPDDEEPALPEVSLFLGDAQDLLKGYYAAKGRQNHVEHGNAMLAWSRKTLSGDAIRAVLGLVEAHEGDAEIEYLARLAIGLSLVSGRALYDIAIPVFADAMPNIDGGRGVGISVDRHCLVVRPGRPKLARAPAMLDFCYPSAEFIVLPLPDAWRSLVEAVVHARTHQRTKAVKRAKALLGQLDTSLNVSESGVRHALTRQLAFVSGGDLGVIKAITDGSEANLDNIIHYVSYEVASLEAMWRKAAQAVVGALPNPLKLDNRNVTEHVGAVHAFNVDQLADYFASIRQRFRQAQEGGAWIKVFNLLTLYLSYWLGLATASRKTRMPVPRVILAHSWAVVTDKSRADGSTDRLVPLTEPLLAQLNGYFALASELAIVAPDLEPLIETERGFELRLQYVRQDGGVTAYRPKYQESHQNLPRLPANWARKLVRSESNDLPGRFRDAGMGHWCSGRNPWRRTSSFDPATFRNQWLDLQARLEQCLGFTLIEARKADATRRAVPKTPTPARNKDAPAARTTPRRGQAPADDAMDDMFKAADEAGFEAVFHEQAANPEVALDLVQRTLKANRSHTQDPVLLAEALCERVRKTTKIPLFAMRPRPQFVRDHVLDTGALQTLAYVQTVVLPAFSSDLGHLPAVEDGDKGSQIELGRLLMIAIWRLGLTHWSLLDAFLKTLGRGAPILATGNLRYIVTLVPFPATREPMRRTIVLDDFSAAYLTVERTRLSQNLAQLFGQTRRRRRAQAERALNQYLASTGVKHKQLKLAAMTGAAVQWLMLNAGPMVASYSGGQFYTQDLDDADLRRLAGLNPPRRGVPPMDAGHAEQSVDEKSDDAIPSDVQHYGQGIIRQLVFHRSPYKAEWRRLIRKIKSESAAERLLQAFALWLVDKSISEDERPKFTRKARGNLRTRLEIVGHALLGFAQSEPSWDTIDEGNLDALAELTREHFPARKHHGAWYRFHAFLRDAAADHAGFTIGHLGYNREHTVSAKILSDSECREIADRLPSARSGIGNPHLRKAARRHFDLIATFGMRRAEAERLRPEDFQRDQLRIQSYGSHTLKTAWAERALPFALAPAEVCEWIEITGGTKQQRLIDPDVQTLADGNNFFNDVNRVIKEVTQDEDLGLHHLRHTVASRLVLSLLSDAVDLNAVIEDLPWIDGLLEEPERLEVLLGYEGNGGQGVQAVSAMLGHSHPTTTLRHYVHVCCVALYAALQSLDTLDMRRSFEKRIASRATVYRKAQTAGTTADDAADPVRCSNRYMRSWIETHINAGVDFDETALPRPAEESQCIADGNTPADDAIQFDRLELLDRVLRDQEETEEPDGIERTRTGLKQLAATPSGKRGSNKPRHPLEEHGTGIFLPPRLAAGSATRAAVRLCEWLEWLRTAHAADFRWLLEKWANASESERGRMRLDEAKDIEQAKHLPTTQYIVIDINAAPTTANRKTRQSKSTPRMRIRCLDDTGKPINRDTGAVRWVMTFVTGMYHSFHDR